MPSRTFTQEEALEASLDFFGGEDFPATTFLNKYALRDENDNYLEKTPADTLKRVAKVLGKALPKAKVSTLKRILGDDYDSKKHKTWEDVFLFAFDNFKGVCPQGSILSAAGNTFAPQSLSNCFVIASPEDSINGIYKASEEEAQLMKKRGGVGMDLSKLRPAGTTVANAARTSTGVPGWMDHFSNTCRSIGQNGRRGALMLTLDVKHPDALAFAQAKRDLSYCTGANVSLKITDEFMDCVAKGKKFKQQWPIDSKNPEMVQEVDAVELWNEITYCAWEMAEPGILMWDNALKNLPAHCYEFFKALACNPCAEIILSAYDSCRLMTMCLIKYVVDQFKEEATFDFKKFERDVRIAMRAMDAVVSAEIEHVTSIIRKIEAEKKAAPAESKGVFNNELNLWKNIRKAAKDGRRTGLGTHGLGDCLAQLRLQYDSEEALVMVDKIYKTLRDVAYDESIEMAIEYGPFPAFDYEVEKSCEFIKRLPRSLKAKMKKHGRRNISILTNAPTGTISIMSLVSSGIEPTFRQMYLRRRKINDNDLNSRVDFVDQNGDKWMEFPQFERNVRRYFQAVGKELPEEVKSDADLNKILPDYFITSDKIDWLKRVEVQATIQQYIDHSISSTINLPSTVTPEEVNKIYTHAHQKGLKGVTVYRDGCRTGVLVTQEESQAPEERPESIKRVEAPKRPEKLACEVHFTKVKGEDYVVIVGLLNGSVYEVFFGKYGNQIPHKHFSGWIEKKSKSKYMLTYIEDVDLKQVDINKYFDNKEYAAATRLLSMSLRHGAPLEFVIEQLQKSSSAIGEFGSAVSRILKKYISVEDLQSRYRETHGDNIEVKIEDGCVTIINLDTGEVESKCS